MGTQEGHNRENLVRRVRGLNKSWSPDFGGEPGSVGWTGWTRVTGSETGRPTKDKCLRGTGQVNRDEAEGGERKDMTGSNLRGVREDESHRSKPE